MRSNRFAAITLLLSGLLFVLAGCDSGGGGAPAADGGSTETEVSVAGNFTGYLKQTVVVDSNALSAGDTGVIVMTGSMRVVGVEPAYDEVHDWSILLDTATLVAESNKTIVLFPNDYTFTLLVTQNDQSYTGTASIVVGEGTNTLTMNISPIIGDTVTDVNVVSELPVFTLNYPELGAAGISQPRLGIIIDEAGTQQIFDLAQDPDTGLFPTMPLALDPPGSIHTIRIELFDGNFLKGRSVASQTNIVAGTDATVDIVSIHGETQVTLNEGSGAATFTFAIPPVVIEEAGGVNSLKVQFDVSGDGNPSYTEMLSLQAPEQEGGDYTASVTFDPTDAGNRRAGFDFGTISVSLTFTDTGINPSEQLGSCLNISVVLIKTSTDAQCDITLLRRSVVSGQLLAVAGINVFESSAPVLGARVFLNDVFVGLSGENANFGTDGYLKVLIPAGTYTLRAEANGLFGETSVVLAPLSVNNPDVALTTPLPDFMIDFEGLAQTEAVNEFYNGGTGGSGTLGSRNVGVSFNPVSIVLTSGNYSGEPSAPTVVFTVSSTPIVANVANGFRSGFSFYYASSSNLTITVYDGLDATGNVLATFGAGETFAGDGNTFNLGHTAGVLFAGIARSVSLTDSGNQYAFDNMTFGTEVPTAGYMP